MSDIVFFIRKDNFWTLVFADHHRNPIWWLFSLLHNTVLYVWNATRNSYLRYLLKCMTKSRSWFNGCSKIIFQSLFFSLLPEVAHRVSCPFWQNTIALNFKPKCRSLSWTFISEGNFKNFDSLCNCVLYMLLVEIQSLFVLNVVLEWKVIFLIQKLSFLHAISKPMSSVNVSRKKVIRLQFLLKGLNLVCKAFVHFRH